MHYLFGSYLALNRLLVHFDLSDLVLQSFDSLVEGFDL